MLSDAQIEKIALFFYFAYLDEIKAQTATVRVLKKINSLFINSVVDEKHFLKHFVSVTSDYIEKHRDSTGMNQLSVISSHVDLPAGSNWGPWFEYRRLAQPKEFLTVLYHHVLGVPVEAVGEALNLPSGTIHYRLSRGLKQLGQICQSGGLNA